MSPSLLLVNLVEATLLAALSTVNNALTPLMCEQVFMETWTNIVMAVVERSLGMKNERVVNLLCEVLGKVYKTIQPTGNTTHRVGR